MDEAGNIVERKRLVLWPLWVTSSRSNYITRMSAFGGKADLPASS